MTSDFLLSILKSQLAIEQVRYDALNQNHADFHLRKQLYISERVIKEIKRQITLITDNTKCSNPPQDMGLILG